MYPDGRALVTVGMVFLLVGLVSSLGFLSFPVALGIAGWLCLMAGAWMG